MVMPTNITVPIPHTFIGNYSSSSVTSSTISTSNHTNIYFIPHIGNIGTEKITQMAEKILNKPRTRKLKAHHHKKKPKNVNTTNKLSVKKSTGNHNKPSIKPPTVTTVTAGNKPTTPGFRPVVHHSWSHGRPPPRTAPPPPPPPQPLPRITPPRPLPPPKTYPRSRSSAIERMPQPRYSSGVGHHGLNEQKPSYSYSSPSSYYSPTHGYGGHHFHNHHGHHHLHHPQFHSDYYPQTHFHGKLDVILNISPIINIISLFQVPTNCTIPATMTTIYKVHQSKYIERAVVIVMP